MCTPRPHFLEIVSSEQWWKNSIKIILVYSSELAKIGKKSVKKFGGFHQTAYLCGPFWEEHLRSGKVDWNNEEQVQFISTKKRVQALISLEKFIVQESSGQARNLYKKYTMKSLILAQDER